MYVKQQETVGSEKWHVYCDRVRDKYKFDINSLEHDAKRTDGYLVTNAINKYAADDDIFFISSSAYDYPYNVYSIHDNQDQICPIGLGSMGATLPQAIDLEGKTVLPGLIDSHVHPPGALLTELYNIDLYSAFNKEDTLNTIKEFVELHPDEEIYWGSGFKN